MSTLELETPAFDLDIRVISPLGKRERRALIRSLYAQLKPWIRSFKDAALDHNQCGLVLSERTLKRGVRTFQSEPVSSELGRLGFEIRMKRLNLGQSQIALAKELQISRPHLSLLERGLHQPRPQTLTRIQQYLEGHTHPLSPPL